MATLDSRRFQPCENCFLSQNPISWHHCQRRCCADSQHNTNLWLWWAFGLAVLPRPKLLCHQHICLSRIASLPCCVAGQAKPRGCSLEPHSHSCCLGQRGPKHHHNYPIQMEVKMCAASQKQLKHVHALHHEPRQCKLSCFAPLPIHEHLVLHMLSTQCFYHWSINAVMLWAQSAVIPSAFHSFKSTKCCHHMITRFHTDSICW